MWMGTTNHFSVQPEGLSDQAAVSSCSRLQSPDSDRPLRRRPISFPPPLPPPSHLPAGHGKTSAAPKRTFRSALVSAEWRAQRLLPNNCILPKNPASCPKTPLVAQKLRSHGRGFLKP